jgi:hypothetical protein
LEFAEQKAGLFPDSMINQEWHSWILIEQETMGQGNTESL